MTTAAGEPTTRALPFQIDVPSFEITAADTVVDVGCGEGLACAYAGRFEAHVIGIDIEPELIDRANQAMRRVPARSWRGIVSDCDPIPLPDGCATVVIATEVLEHVEDSGRFLAELVRIGRPGARYLISVPDPASESVMRAVAPRWYWQKPLHIHVFEHDELDALLTAAGLRVEERHAAGFYWSIWWALRMAIGMEHKYAPPPPSPLLRSWDDVMEGLLQSPNGYAALRALDDLVPKSQVVLARKPAEGTGSPSSLGGPSWRRGRLRRLVRNGSVRLGGFDLQWRVRRSRPSRP